MTMVIGLTEDRLGNGCLFVCTCMHLLWIAIPGSRLHFQS